MIKDEKDNIESDPTLLLVSAGRIDFTKEEESAEMKKLTNAGVQTFLKHGKAKFRAVGKSASYRALKACIMTKGELSKRGEQFLVDPSFVVIDFGENKRSGINLELVKVDRSNNIID